ncbi:MAG: hypothetical protein JNJ55_03990 [Betaproteobacteria bacterium]|nr:hypothetical protein [Betaproteobacteria bacterium]
MNAGARSEPAASIARMGFRKWYERQLIDGHLALVTCILAAFLAAASLEAFTFPASVPALAGCLTVFGVACGITCVAWRRYQRTMTGAWRLGEKAVCAQCAAYGRFEVESAGIGGEQQPWLDVRCRKCGFKWRMPD